MSRLKLADLSKREREVAELCTEPLTAGEIAARLKRLDGRGFVSRAWVQACILRIADRIGGDGRPRLRVSNWVVQQRGVTT